MKSIQLRRPLGRVGRRVGSIAWLAFFVACQGNTPTGPGGNQNFGTISATINGEAWSAEIGRGGAVNAANAIAVNAVNGAGTSLSFAVPAAVGTVTLATLIPATATLSTRSGTVNTGTWIATGAQGGGSITVTSLTVDGATGTFLFTMVPIVGTGATGNRIVANGTFNVRFSTPT